MKIAIVVEIINYHSGARAPLEIAMHLAKLRHKVTLYAYSYNEDYETRKDVIRMGVSIVVLNKVPLPFIGKYITAFSLFWILKKSSPKVIAYAGTLPFFLSSKLTLIPIILMYHGTQPNAYLERKNPDEQITLKDKLLNQIANMYIYLVNGILVYLSKEIVAISKFAAKEVERLYRKKAHSVIYLGTTSLLLDKQSTKKKNASIDILSVSRITPYKGFHLIIEAIKKIKTNRKIILTIVGSQPKTSYLQYLKKIGKEIVQIVINPSDKELSKIYQRSDIYVNADRYLYFGLPIVEAAQFEKPTVSLNFAAAKELIMHGKTGFVANDLNEFSNYLQKLIEDENLRHKLGYNALQWSKTFSWEKCAKEWEKVLLKYE